MRKLVTLLVIISFAFSGCTGAEEIGVTYNGTEYRNPVEVPNFSLTDQDGNQVNLSDFQGNVVVVAFIFTNCPDVCPAIEHTLNYVDSMLPDHGIENDVEFISITIDPARDTVEALNNYTTANSFDWPHLTSSNPDDLVQVWSDWNIVVDNDHIYSDHSNHSSHDSHNSDETSNNSGNESDEGGHEGHGDHSSDSGQEESADSDTEYTVGHSTVTFILDQEGNKRVAWSGYDWDAELFLEDLVTMVYGSNQDSDDHAEHAHH